MESGFDTVYRFIVMIIIALAIANGIVAAFFNHFCIKRLDKAKWELDVQARILSKQMEHVGASLAKMLVDNAQILGRLDALAKRLLEHDKTMMFAGIDALDRAGRVVAPGYGEHPDVAGLGELAALKPHHMRMMREMGWELTSIPSRLDKVTDDKLWQLWGNKQSALLTSGPRLAPILDWIVTTYNFSQNSTLNKSA